MKTELVPKIHPSTIILEQDANRKMGRNYTSTDDEHLINLSVGSDNRPLMTSEKKLSAVLANSSNYSRARRHNI